MLHAVARLMPSQPTRVSGRETRAPERFRNASQPIRRRVSPPPSPPREKRPVVPQPGIGLAEAEGQALPLAPVRLEVIGIGEEEEILELEEIVQGGVEARREEAEVVEEAGEHEIEEGGAEAEVQQDRERGHGAGRVDLTPFINPIIPDAIQGPPT